jgi:hypothetical protein
VRWEIRTRRAGRAAEIAGWSRARATARQLRHAVGHSSRPRDRAPATSIHRVVSPSRFRRSLARTGPLGVALILGALLVASSALSYSDARSAAGFVAERRGVGLLHRLDAELSSRAGSPVLIRSLKSALDASRSLGLLYVGVYDSADAGPTRIVAEIGETLLAGTQPRVGAPAFGQRRVRMVSPGAGEHPFGPFGHEGRLTGRRRA